MMFLSASTVVLAITGRAARCIDTAKPWSAHEARPKSSKRVGTTCLYIACSSTTIIGLWATDALPPLRVSEGIPVVIR